MAWFLLAKKKILAYSSDMWTDYKIIKPLWESSPETDNLTPEQVYDYMEAKNYDSIMGSDGHIPKLLNIIRKLDEKLNEIILENES